VTDAAEPGAVTRSGCDRLPPGCLMAGARNVSMSGSGITALMGVGFGLAFSAMSALIVAAVPPSQTGVASGMNANIRTIGGSIGAAVMASIVTSQLEPSGLPREAGYTTGFAVMAGGLVLAALAGLLMPSAQRMRDTAGGPEHAEMAMVAGGTVVGDDSE
jgi:hypothetical protein